MQSTCTCPTQISHAAQLCDSCERELHNWLDDQAEQARNEARIISPRELRAALALFELRTEFALDNARTINQLLSKEETHHAA